MKKNILLLHGWDYDLYTKRTSSKDAWENYQELIRFLENKYNIYKLNFPGFCHEKEPKEKVWNIDDYVKYVERYISNNNLNIDYVLGYSFGGAVAAKWKVITKAKTKLILIAPAIIRNSNKSHKFIKTPKFLNPIRNILKDIYVIHILKNPEMRYGTKFLRNSYQSIVRSDLRKELFSINNKDIKLIYGNKDTAVAPKEIVKSAPKSFNCIHMIDNANHDNIITDYLNELTNIINL